MAPAERETAEDLRQRYDSDGFLICREPVVPAPAVDAAVAGMDAIRAGVYDTGVPPRESLWNPGDDPARLCKIECPQFASDAVFDLVSHAAIGRLAAAITGASAVQVWWVQLLYKPPGAGAAGAATSIGWHQDRKYWQCWEEGSELLTAWVALSDVRPESGPMAFVRGSHRWGLQADGDFYAPDLATQQEALRVPAGDRWQEVQAVMPAGAVSFHHNLTLHGSRPNTDAGPRRSFAIHLRTDRSRPVGDRREGLTRFIDDPSRNPWIWPAGDGNR